MELLKDSITEGILPTVRLRINKHYKNEDMGIVMMMTVEMRWDGHDGDRQNKKISSAWSIAPLSYSESPLSSPNWLHVVTSQLPCQICPSDDISINQESATKRELNKSFILAYPSWRSHLCTNEFIWIKNDSQLFN